MSTNEHQDKYSGAIHTVRHPTKEVPVPMSTSRVIPVAPGPARPACALGPLFLDVVMTGLYHAPRPGEEQWVVDCAMMPGGCANQAVALARLGLPVLLRATLGRDRAGGLVRTMLEEDGIDLSSCEAVDRQNVTVSLAFDDDRAMTTVGSDASPALEGLGVLPAVLVTDLRAVAANESVISGWRSGDAPTAVVGDVGWDDTGHWDPADLEPLDQVDVFVPNEGEALRYTRTDTPLEAARVLARRVPLVVVTCGADGVIACSADEEIALPATPQRPVDTTGAGDSFTAGLVRALAAGAGLRAALTLGSLTASRTVGLPGGSAAAPTLEEVRLHADSLELPEDYDLSVLDLPTTPQ